MVEKAEYITGELIEIDYKGVMFTRTAPGVWSVGGDTTIKSSDGLNKKLEEIWLQNQRLE